MRLTFECRLPCAYLIIALVAAPSALAAQSSANSTFKVAEQEIVDFKSVLATVRSRDRIEARVRTAGTITTLSVDEGAQVKSGQRIAMVVDDKIELRLKGIDARILALETRVATARSDLERAKQLTRRKISPETRLEAAQTTYDAAEGELKAARAERSIVEVQMAEGEVLAAADGRVLKVPVTVGSVVMQGESIATIAANAYLLRLELPERHARFIKTGDTIRVGARGLGPDKQPVSKGRIVQVYPLLASGRVVADAEVSGLGNYFVGERALVWISVGARKTILVPRTYLFRRFSLDFVRLAASDGSTTDVVVQLGRETPTEGDATQVEVLAGIHPGDVLVSP